MLDHQENRQKRERAERKIQEEKAVQKLREKEIMEVREKLEDFTQIRETLKKHVNKHKIYEVKKRNQVGVASQLFQELPSYNSDKLS